YWTACADDEIDTTAAAGAVHLIQSGIASCFPFDPVASVATSEEESDGAEERIGVRAGRILVDRLAVVRLQHQLGRGEDRDAGGVELQLPGAGRRIVVGAGKAARLQV